MPPDIEVGTLTRFEVASDGASVRVHLEDVAGRPIAVSLPLDCVNGLVMTLPAMLTAALRCRHRDPSLRVTYPLGGYRVESGSDRSTRILTLSTPEAFSVSFGTTERVLRGIGGAADGLPSADDLQRPN